MDTAITHFYKENIRGLSYLTSYYHPKNGHPQNMGTHIASYIQSIETYTNSNTIANGYMHYFYKNLPQETIFTTQDIHEFVPPLSKYTYSIVCDDDKKDIIMHIEPYNIICNAHEFVVIKDLITH